MKFKPIPHDVEKDKSYFWCSCGKSKNQPFCDGSHAGSEFTPLKYVAEKFARALGLKLKTEINSVN